MATTSPNLTNQERKVLGGLLVNGPTAAPVLADRLGLNEGSVRSALTRLISLGRVDTQRAVTLYDATPL